MNAKLKVRADRLEKFIWLCLERHRIKMAKDADQPRPWTQDPILNKYHFCNVFRRLDKTSLVIHGLIEEHEFFDDRTNVAILGRLVNRAGTIRPAWGARTETAENLAEVLSRLGVNTNAYRLNTPRGLNNIRGLVELIQADRWELAQKLQAVSSLKEAYEVIDDAPFIRGFVGYQIILDLYETGSWPDDFDGNWALAGPGACRGMLWLSGESPNYDWTSSEFRQDKGALLGRMPDLMAALTAVVQNHWPKDWPTFSVHETEFMLCELDKYLRKESSDRPSGRLYKPNRT